MEPGKKEGGRGEGGREERKEGEREGEKEKCSMLKTFTSLDRQKCCL